MIKPRFEGVRASANPAYEGNERCVDPEEAYVTSLSSCHMLTFLAIACKKRITVDGYQDQAVGILEKDRAQSHEGPSNPRDSTRHPGPRCFETSAGQPLVRSGRHSGCPG